MFEIFPGTDNFAFRQNTIHGGQPIAQFYSSAKGCTFHGGCQIPNTYNKTFVDILIADIYNDIYIETEIGTLISNIGLSSYYIKAEIGTLFSNIALSNYYIKTKIGTLVANIYLSNYYTKPEVDHIDNELSTLILNTYTKTEVDTLVYTNYPSLSFIGDNFLFKTEIDSTLSDYTTTTQLYDGFYSKGYVHQMLVQSTTLYSNFIIRKETPILY